MKLFNWVQNRLNGKQESNITNLSPPYKRETKEEFSDWPQAFLSIGTLGIKDLKEENKVQKSNNKNIEDNSEEYLTSAEIGQLQKELNALVSNSNTDHLDILATLEAVNVGDQENFGDDQEEGDQIDQKKRFSAINAPKNNNNRAISKKSVSFLLKKMFLCGLSGFESAPCLRDSILSPSQTRMEKILRAILHKKIYPQNPSHPTSKNKYLERRYVSRTKKGDDHDDHDDEDDDSDLGNEGSKWVKTDTDFIVLEI